jgi:hypothetical protein
MCTGLEQSLGAGTCSSKHGEVPSQLVVCDVDCPVQDLEVVEYGVDEEEPGVVQGHTDPAGGHDLCGGGGQGKITMMPILST